MTAILLFGCTSAPRSNGAIAGFAPPDGGGRAVTSPFETRAPRPESATNPVPDIEVASSPPAPPPSAPEPAEPDAEALVRSIWTSIVESGAPTRREIRIGVGRLRNQSRSSITEFKAFVDRFAVILDAAAAGTRLRFVARGAEGTGTEYELQGTAYLVTRDGVDRWEVFPQLSPAGGAWTLWQAAEPVLVLRSPLRGQPQIRWRE